MPKYEVLDNYPPHECSRPGCKNITTRRFLCDDCYHGWGNDYLGYEIDPGPDEYEQEVLEYETVGEPEEEITI